MPRRSPPSTQPRVSNVDPEVGSESSPPLPIGLDRDAHPFNARARALLDDGVPVAEVAQQLGLDGDVLKREWERHQLRAACYWLMRGCDVGQVLAHFKLDAAWIEEVARDPTWIDGIALHERRRRGVLLALSDVPIPVAAALSGLTEIELLRWIGYVRDGFEHEMTEDGGPLDAGRKNMRPAVQALADEDRLAYRRAMESIDLYFERVEGLKQSNLPLASRQQIHRLIEVISYAVRDVREDTAARQSFVAAIRMSLAFDSAKQGSEERAAQLVQSTFSAFYPRRAAKLDEENRRGFLALKLLMKSLKVQARKTGHVDVCDTLEKILASEQIYPLLRGALAGVDLLVERETLAKEFSAARRRRQDEDLIGDSPAKAEHGKPSTAPPSDTVSATARPSARLTDENRGQPSRRRGRPRAISRAECDTIKKLWNAQSKEPTRRAFHAMVKRRLKGRKPVSWSTFNRLMSELFAGGELKSTTGSKASRT